MRQRRASRPSGGGLRRSRLLRGGVVLEAENVALRARVVALEGELGLPYSEGISIAS